MNAPDPASPDEPAPQHRGPARGRREWLLLAAMLAAFLCANLLTADRSPTVWQDEVMFVDPAANLYLDRGLVSTAWWQPEDRYWAGYPPLGIFLLRGWLEIFGLSPTAARSLNYVYIAIGALVLWQLARRTGAVQTPQLRLLFVALLLCGFGIANSYRSGRPDAAGFLWIACVVSAMCMRTPAQRIPTVILCAALLPWTGAQLLPYVVLLGVSAFLFWRFATIRPAIPAVVGVTVGIATMLGFFAAHGALADFRQSVLSNAGSRGTLVSRLAEIPSLYREDPSTGALIVLTVVLLLWHRQRRAVTPAGPLWWALAAAVVIPCGMYFAGRFPIYYSWMAYVPIAACVILYLDRADLPAGWMRRGVFAFVACTILIGLPLRLLMTAAQWETRDYAPVTDFIRENVRPDDRVFADYQPYYALMPLAARVYLPTHLSALGSEARKRVGVLIVTPADAAVIQRAFPGRWTLSASFAAPRGSSPLLRLIPAGRKARPYRLQILRRAEADAAATAEGSG